ncbi:MAG: hypothetical protein KUG77_17780 [Nannocystaceae bacterium]|nr:hypothetical protein [Nannocystaceae bacterium]
MMHGFVTEPACVLATPDFALGYWRDVFICSWRVRTTMEGAGQLVKHCAEFGTTRSSGIGLLTIIEANAPAPENDARAAIADFLGSAAYIRGSGVAFEGTGFRAAAVRSIVSGLTMLARQPYEHKVFDAVPATMTWLVPELSEHLSVDYSAGQAVDAVAGFRARVDAEVPKRSA